VRGGDAAVPKLRWDFYRAMHYSAKRGLAIACRLYVRLFVCLSVFALRSPKVIHLLLGNIKTFSWTKCSFNTYVHNVNRESRDVVIFGGVVVVCLLLSAHRAVIFAIAQLSCLLCSFGT